MEAISQPGSSVDGPGRLWRALHVHDAPLSYPVVAAVEGPELLLPQWRRRLRSWLSDANGERGALALEGHLSSLFSLFFFVVRTGPTVGRHLHVPRLWLVEIGTPDHVPRATLAGIEAAARGAGCKGVALDPRHVGIRSLGEALGIEKLGYAISAGGRRWLRRLDNADDG